MVEHACGRRVCIHPADELTVVKKGIARERATSGCAQCLALRVRLTHNELDLAEPLGGPSRGAAL